MISYRRTALGNRTGRRSCFLVTRVDSAASARIKLKSGTSRAMAILRRVDRDESTFSVSIWLIRLAETYTMFANLRTDIPLLSRVSLILLPTPISLIQ